MKKKVSFLILFLLMAFNSIGQINPIENLTWSQTYQYPNNFFELNWDEPTLPHDNLIGYNIYRNGELYRFQTEKTIYYLNTPLNGIVSNCGGDFINYYNPNNPTIGEFDINVTAVYDPGQIESSFKQTVHSYGALLNNTNFVKEKPVIFPNPTKGLVNIRCNNIEKIIIYDSYGKFISEFEPKSQIDLSYISKGLYIIKLFFKEKIIINKLVVE